MIMRRPIYALAAAMVMASAIPAEISLQQKGNQIHIVRDGVLVSQRPARFVVQEWQRRQADAPANAARAGVGSIVETDALESVLLSPANDAWTEEPVSVIVGEGNVYTQELVFPRELSVTAEWSAENGGVRVRGKVRNLSTTAERREIPITFSLAIPVDGESLTWLADNHRSEAIEGTTEILNTVATTAGPRGAMSRYPFAAIAGDRQLAVGMPLDQPRIQRLLWDGKHRALVAEVDVTISPDTEKFPGYVPFDFMLFDFEAEFGFRSVANAYYALNPDSYSTRIDYQGQWMPFTQIDSVQRAEDFRFAFHEYHPNVSVAYNTAQGIESLVYCEPPVQYINVAANVPKELASLLGILDGMGNTQGSQVRGSGTWDRSGNLQAAWVETPWAVGARVPTNGDPELPRTARNPHNSFDANWLPYRDLWQRRAEDQPAAWNGGRIMEGVVGASGRALNLRAGESSELVLSNAADLKLSITAMGAPGATVSVGIGDAAQAFPLSRSFAALEFAASAAPGASLRLTAQGGDVYIDSITGADAALANAQFDAGRLDEEAVTGLYLDSFEGWDSKDLNFRREHFATSDYPLTFDARTGETAQVIMMHNFELAAEARRRLHARGDLLMANTALYQWSWSAHFLDVLGIETSWGEGERIVPPKIADLDYLRTMLYHKPYCYLQNLRFDMFRGQKVEDYFARCLHYGMWPSFFSFNAAEEPYWQNPGLYNADRAYFLTFMEPQGRMTRGGWEPITLAASANRELLVERWGGGAWKGEPLSAESFYISIYNPSERMQSGDLRADARLTAETAYLVLDALTGRSVENLLGRDGSVPVRLRSLGVSSLWFVARTEVALGSVLRQEVGELLRLSGKYQRYGLIDAATVAALKSALAAATPSESEKEIAKLLSTVGGEYRAEIERSYSTWRIASAALEEVRGGKVEPIALPRSIARGVEYRIQAPASSPVELELKVTTSAGEQNIAFRDGVAQFVAPATLEDGAAIGFLVSRAGAAGFVPYLESSAVLVPPVELLGLPRRVVVGPPTMLTVAVRNNLPTKAVGEVSFAASSLASASPMPLELAPGEERAIQLRLVAASRPAMDMHEPLAIGWNAGDDDAGAASAEVPLVLLSADASLLRTSGVTVTVDSFYFGYDKLAITDGVRDGAGLDWTETAWASDEGMVPHWAQFDFEKPTILREVRIFWAFDSGKHWTSRELTVEGWRPGATAWEVLARHGDGTLVPETRLAFPAGEYTRIRLYQPPGGGAAERPGLLWLGEVEAR